MADDKPIIIIKKKGGHGGHHGGAWKIAYADFVTAMMCFFLVMWLVNSAEVSTRQNIASYFRRPGIFSEGSGTPLMIGGAGILEDAYAPQKPEGNKGSERPSDQPMGTPSPTPKVRITQKKTGEDKKTEPTPTPQPTIPPGTLPEEVIKAVERQQLEDAARQIQRELSAMPDLAKLLGIVNFNFEGDGLSIDIMDTDKESMFNSGSAQILPEARAAFGHIAKAIEKMPNKIEIVGHTDSKPFSNRVGGYSNWELSADRANAARKIMELNGVPSSRITSVVGRADKELFDSKNPFASSNRRITLKIRFNFDRKIDLKKDPGALDRLKDYVPVASEPVIPELGAVPSAPQPSPTPTSRPRAQGYSPKKIVKAAEKESNKIALPDVDPGNPSPSSSPSGGLFDDSPVISGDPFSNF